MSARPTGPPIDRSLYVAVLPVVLAGPVCAADRLISASGLFAFSLCLILFGVPFSLHLRRRGVSRVAANRVVSLAALVLGAMVLSANDDVWLIFSPSQALNSNVDDLAITYLIRGVTWIIAFRCLSLLSDIDILLSIGFSLSLFILVALVEPEGRVVWSLAPLVGGSLYLLTRYQRNALHAQADEVLGQGSEAAWSKEAAALGAMGGGVAAVAVLLSLLLSGASLPLTLLESTANRLSDYLDRLHSSAATGGIESSMDVGDVGGSISPAVVFEVETDSAELWRGNVFNAFDGQEWRVAVGRGGRPVQAEPGIWLLNRSLPYPLPPGAYAKHRIRLNKGGQALLYSVNGAVLVEAPRVRVWSNSVGRLAAARELPRGYQYSLVTPREGPDPAIPAPALSDRDRLRFLTPPQYRSPRIDALVETIVADRRSPRGKLDALAAWLADHKTYTRRPEPIPEEANSVEYFLFDMDSGWCRHFASALAIMGRSAGIPTRLVTGYLPGEADRAGHYVVRERDAHAWIEAWVEGGGWITYDVTAQTEEKLSPLAQSFQAARLWVQAFRGSPAGRAVIAVALLLGFVGLLWWLFRGTGAAVVRRSRAGWRGRARRLDRAVLRAAARAGLERRPSHSVWSLCERLALRVPDLGADLLRLGEALSGARYGRRAMTAADRRHARATLAALRKVPRA